MPHGRIADQRGEVRKRRDRLFNCVAGGHFVMGRRRLDDDSVAAWLDADQFLDLAEIDDVGWRGQPLFHYRDQRVAAGQIFRVRTLGEQACCFVDRRGAVIGGLVHDASPSQPWIACQTRSGVAGISSLLLPIASVIALITAAEAPMAPASPPPFTPSGLLGHSVVVWLSLNDGTSSARGMA